ncbi:MAG: MerR family DNA-binding transcriptional regulator [Planctomycetes bacterium]|nr:MerR family DNA-binding transcriptional regulator [Planctomycetota bacterium]
MAADEQLVNANVVADYFGVTVDTVRRWTRLGAIPSLRPSPKVIRYMISEVRQALAQEAASGAGRREGALDG